MELEAKAVLEANRRFYEAFAARSVEALTTVLAREHPVSVIHPGWPPLFGREEVLESWRRIVEGPAPPDIRCGNARAVVIGELAVVVCTEHLADGDLVATNLFARESGGWRMIHHHAGPLPRALDAPPGTVH